MDTIEKRRRDGKAHGMFPDMPDPYPSRFPLSGRDQRIYRVLRLLYGQQKYMYDEKVNSVADGMARTEHISWGNFNESKDLELQVRAYRKTHGRWPELLLADRAYLNREGI